MPSGKSALVLGAIAIVLVLQMVACTEGSSAPAEPPSFSPTQAPSPSPSGEIEKPPEPTPTETALDAEIETAVASGKLVLIFFYSGCAPCKYRSQITILDELEKTYQDRLMILRIGEPEPAAQFGVVTSPTLLLLGGTDNGAYTVLQRFEGVTDKITLENAVKQALGGA